MDPGGRSRPRAFSDLGFVPSAPEIPCGPPGARGGAWTSCLHGATPPGPLARPRTRLRERRIPLPVRGAGPSGPGPPPRSSGRWKIRPSETRSDGSFVRSVEAGFQGGGGDGACRAPPSYRPRMTARTGRDAVGPLRPPEVRPRRPGEAGTCGKAPAQEPVSAPSVRHRSHASSVGCDIAAGRAREDRSVLDRRSRRRFPWRQRAAERAPRMDRRARTGPAPGPARATGQVPRRPLREPGVGGPKLRGRYGEAAVDARPRRRSGGC